MDPLGEDKPLKTEEQMFLKLVKALPPQHCLDVWVLVDRLALDEGVGLPSRAPPLAPPRLGEQLELHDAA
jgi:hypothetical protein